MLFFGWKDVVGEGDGEEKSQAEKSFEHQKKIIAITVLIRV